MLKKFGISTTILSLLLLGACSQKTPTTNGVYDDAIDSDARAKRPIAGNPVPNEPLNLLANPGFESGLDGWVWLDWSKGWAPFTLSSDHAYSGQYSLHLPLYSSDRRQTVVWGGVQEVQTISPNASTGTTTSKTGKPATGNNIYNSSSSISPTHSPIAAEMPNCDTSSAVVKNHPSPSAMPNTSSSKKNDGLAPSKENGHTLA